MPEQQYFVRSMFKINSDIMQNFTILFFLVFLIMKNLPINLLGFGNVFIISLIVSSSIYLIVSSIQHN